MAEVVSKERGLLGILGDECCVKVKTTVVRSQTQELSLSISKDLSANSLLLDPVVVSA